ncbi:hypothetical protein AA574_21420, partial [Salmonella enterica subsp. enterica serovar Enteritidis]|nr:hypothetical protein [Salmonella enterica subsp. enterica serovar Enteritidis]
MSGKPAARQGDMTQVGGPIVQGSAGVLIGAPTGVACSVCPTGEASPKYGNPVNPLLGAKVLPGETDIALPAPLPPYRVLTGVVDGYGRRLTYHRDGAYGGAVTAVTAVTDSTGRRYRLVLSTQAQRAAQAAS